MTITQEELLAGPTDQAASLRIVSEASQVKTFAGIAASSLANTTVPKGTVVVKNRTTAHWQGWAKPVSEIDTLTAHATPATAGDFTITVNGVASAAIAFDCTAAVLQAALVAMQNVDVGDVVVTCTEADMGVAAAVATITWGGQYEATQMTLAYTDNTTGNAHVLAVGTAGVDSVGLDEPKGIVWPDTITLHATAQVLGNVMFAGKAHYDDLVKADATGSTAQFAAALSDGEFRKLGIYLDGLPAFV